MIRLVRSRNYRKARSTKKQTGRKKDWVVDQEKNLLLPSFPAITLSVFKAANYLIWENIDFHFVSMKLDSLFIGLMRLVINLVSNDFQIILKLLKSIYLSFDKSVVSINLKY